MKIVVGRYEGSSNEKASAMDKQTVAALVSTLHKTVGMRVREARREQGLDQLGLALMVGYKSASAITQIEKGTMNSSLSKLYMIAVVLNKEIVEFFPNSALLDQSPIASGHFQATERAARSLPFFARKECADLFRVIAEDLGALPRPGMS